MNSATTFRDLAAIFERAQAVKDHPTVIRVVPTMIALCDADSTFRNFRLRDSLLYKYCTALAESPEQYQSEVLAVSESLLSHMADPSHSQYFTPSERSSMSVHLHLCRASTFFFGLKMPEEAIVEATLALPTRLPNCKSSLQALLLRGTCYLSSEQFEELERDLELLRELKRNSESLHGMEPEIAMSEALWASLIESHQIEDEIHAWAPDGGAFKVNERLPPLEDVLANFKDDDSIESLLRQKEILEARLQSYNELGDSLKEEVSAKFDKWRYDVDSSFATRFAEEVSKHLTVDSRESNWIGYNSQMSLESNLDVLCRKFFESGSIYVYENDDIGKAAPHVCLRRLLVDAIVCLGFQVEASSQCSPEFFGEETPPVAVLRFSDSIKSPLLLNDAWKGSTGLTDFVEVLDLPHCSAELVLDVEGIVLAYHLVLHRQFCGDCLMRWVIQDGRIVHSDCVPIQSCLPLSEAALVDVIETFVELPSPARWNLSSAEFLDDLKRRQRVACRDLHNVLLGGLENWLDGASVLTFVPDRHLFRVPFSALMDETGTYLIEKCSIAISNSLRMIGKNAEQREATLLAPNRIELLVCGGAIAPNVPRDFVEEVRRVVNRFSKTTLPLISLVGEEFVPLQVRKCCSRLAPRIVHVVAHGIARDTPDHGPNFDILEQFRISGKFECSGECLRARDVASDFDLRSTHLVFLNCCSLGDGLLRELGVLGFNRALFEAGCPSVIGALWPVWNVCSEAIADSFYRYYLRDEADKAECLRRAILDLFPLLRDRHPLFRNFRDFPVLWGSYHLFGNRV